MPSPQTPDWVKDAVFYQIFPDRFASSTRVPKPPGLEPWGAPPTLHGYQGGDLWGVVEHLDHLSGLGFNALYLTPIFSSPANHRYHTHDYFAVDPMLGGQPALRGLLEAAHDRGMRVVLDGVFNHTGRGFLPFADILENGPSSPWIDWFRVRRWPMHAYDEEGAPGYDCWWGLRALPQLNHEHPQVREYLMEVGEHWVRAGIDGWRLDVPSEITVPGFWTEFRSRVKAIEADAYLCGEIWVDATDWLQGDQFDGVMNYEITGPTIAYLAGDRVDTRLTEGRSYTVSPALDAGGWMERVEKVLARHPWEITLTQLNLLDSHDTARLITIAQGDASVVRLGTLLLMSLPGAPCVYYGDEIGLPGGLDPDCRRAFPWSTPGTWNVDLLDAHRQLIALRHRHVALRRGAFRPLLADGSVAVFARTLGDDAVIVAVNAATEGRSVTLAPDLLDQPDHLVPLWGAGRLAPTPDGPRLELPPRAGLVLG